MRVPFMILGLALAGLSPPLASLPALAQTAAPAEQQFQQIQLTDALVKQYLAAAPEIDKAINEAPPSQGDTPDPKFLAKLDALAKAHGFADFTEYDSVAGNMALVLEGVDRDAKTYVGPKAIADKEIAAIKADAKISDADKKQALAELADELKSTPPLKYPGNIDVVMKNIDALAAGPGQTH